MSTNHKTRKPEQKDFFTLPDGFEECNHCNGYGSSLKDPVGVNTCTKCGGSGLMQKEIKTNE